MSIPSTLLSLYKRVNHGQGPRVYLNCSWIENFVLALALRSIEFIALSGPDLVMIASSQGQQSICTSLK